VADLPGSLYLEGPIWELSAVPVPESSTQLATQETKAAVINDCNRMVERACEVMDRWGQSGTGCCDSNDTCMGAACVKRSGEVKVSAFSPR
jgi:hypothetical protein